MWIKTTYLSAYDLQEREVNINIPFDKIDNYDFKLKLEEYPILNGVKYLSFISDNKYVTYEREL